MLAPQDLRFGGSCSGGFTKQCNAQQIPKFTSKLTKHCNAQKIKNFQTPDIYGRAGCSFSLP